MARLFALADLHLSLAGTKPMDVFGELWRDHTPRMAESWDRRVAAEDTVLLPGDLSWARNLEEAGPDLAWIGERPGRKLLLRGNHDSWWGSAARVRAALPEGCELLQNDAHRVDDRVVVGARGWLEPDDPHADEHAGRIFRRELERLRMSIRHADRDFGRDPPRVAMLHFPPWIEGRPPTAVVEVLRAGGVGVVVYGHLHGEDHALAVRGRRDGMLYCFVAADAVGFAPAEIPRAQPMAEEVR
jgi:predicted phosphohydrolase